MKQKVIMGRIHALIVVINKREGGGG